MGVWLFFCLVIPCPSTAQGLSPAESEKKIRLADPNLVKELVTSEPHIESPVALTWDADGAMYVIQMSDYPTSETGGSIRRLYDADRDGIYEQATTFASGLKWPSGALAWNDGLLVTAAPDILFLQDRDGDGIAEHREVMFTGFVEGNQQLRVNGLIWGLDNLVYGANGRSGGNVRSMRAPNQPAVSIQRDDFRFDPISGQFEAIAGLSQFGLGRDDFNHRFLSWNTIPFRQAVIEQADLRRNPSLTRGESIALITDSQDTGRVFPISSPPKTFNRERTDYFNASCGSMIFRGHGLGADYHGNAFVAEPLTNLVHRKVLTQQGPLFIAKRIEQNQEFFGSEDNWTHPVFPALGPDGTLYIADFYREWVEHPQFVQEALRKGIDFRVGHEHGRIWRVRHKDFRAIAPPSLKRMTNTELVALLETDNAWARETAQRLLVERKPTDVTDALNKVALHANHPVSRVQALWTLQGIGSLSAETLVKNLLDSSAAVRCQAIELARRFHSQHLEVNRQVLSLHDDTDEEVRFRLTLFAGDSATAESRRALANIALRDAENEWMRLAILSGLREKPEEFVEVLQHISPTAFRNPSPGVRTLLRETIALVARTGDLNDQRLTRLVAMIAEMAKKDRTLGLILLAGLGEGLAHTPAPLNLVLKHPPQAWSTSVSDLSELISSTPDMVRDAETATSTRLVAWDVLVKAKPDEASSLFEDLLNPLQPEELQSAAARAVGESAIREIAQSLMENWGTYTLSTRRGLLTSLSRRSELVSVLLDGLEQGQLQLREVDFTTRDILARHADPDVKERVKKLFHSQANSNRQEIVKKYAQSAEQSGNNQRGAVLFAQHCAVCHQMRGEGARVGPDLSGIASRPKPAILADIMDPSRDISPDFTNYVVATKQGQVLMGLLVAETPGGVRLRRQQAAEDFVSRADIEELRSNSKSMMPEGFEERFNEQELSDLLEFLHHPVPFKTEAKP